MSLKSIQIFSNESTLVLRVSAASVNVDMHVSSAGRVLCSGKSDDTIIQGLLYDFVCFNLIEISL